MAVIVPKQLKAEKYVFFLKLSVLKYAVITFASFVVISNLVGVSMVFSLLIIPVILIIPSLFTYHDQALIILIINVIKLYFKRDKSYFTDTEVISYDEVIFTNLYQIGFKYPTYYIEKKDLFELTPLKVEVFNLSGKRLYVEKIQLPILKRKGKKVIYKLDELIIEGNALQLDKEIKGKKVNKKYVMEDYDE